MMGVIAPASDPRVVSEFFELFKTPWEPFRTDRQYDVIVCVDDEEFDPNAAKLVVHYGSGPLAIDSNEGRQPTLHHGPEILFCNDRSLVLYGNYLTFHDAGERCEGDSSGQWSYRCARNSVVHHRIGYDLFAEIAKLLTEGQPADFAHLPTVDIHIALLREIILESGLDLIEIPPVPYGYGCIACLTHDIDHPAIRNHRWDATALGFLYRATAGSLIDFCRGRKPFRSVVDNWAAAVKLPFVYAGLATDFWAGFEQRYLWFEQGLPTTYFVIPFRDRPGKTANGIAPRRRASRYAAGEIETALRSIRENGNEVGLHGIDAWIDGASAEQELAEVRRVTQAGETGVRMHWLFFDERSPMVLDRGGASYDSSIGYRETIGFRCGTSQAYRPIGAERLLELPLHVMDTALFYPAYLGYSQSEAEQHIGKVVQAVAEYGGCLTINWHDRSLAAERIWKSSYRSLLDDLRKHRAWFATADQVVSWFRLRRSVVFGESKSRPRDVHADVRTLGGRSLPNLRIRRAKMDHSGMGGSRMSCIDELLEPSTLQYESPYSRN